MRTINMNRLMTTTTLPKREMIFTINEEHETQTETFEFLDCFKNVAAHEYILRSDVLYVVVFIEDVITQPQRNDVERFCQCHHLTLVQ